MTGSSPQVFPPEFRRLERISVSYIATMLAGTVVAIRAQRAAEFGGSHTDATALRSFLVGMGTAMSPPLLWLLAQGALTGLLRFPGRRQSIGSLGLGAGGLIGVVGVLGEPMTRENLTTRHTTVTRFLLQLALVVLPLAMAVQAIRALVHVFEADGAPSPTDRAG